MIVGITGGMGSGKSVAADYFENQGFVVIDSDKISRKLTEKGSPVLPELAFAFGGEIINEDGSLNRRALANVAFSSKEGTAKLNSIMHAKIYAKIKEEIEFNLKRNQDAPIFVDVPLLFEVGWKGLFDKVLLVTAPENTRIKRVMDRDGLSKAEVLDRMSKQMKEEEKAKLADFMVLNSGDYTKLYRQLEGVLKEINFEN